MKSRNYLLIALGVLAVLVVVSPAQADVLAYWQFNEATSGTIPTSGGPVLDSSGNGHHAYGQSAAWGPGVNFDTDPTDGSLYCSSHANRVLAPHSTDFDMMLGDGQSYRFEMDIKSNDWISNLAMFMYHNNGQGGDEFGGYRLHLVGTNSVEAKPVMSFAVWSNTDASSYWITESDPTLAWIPDHRAPGEPAWHHIAVEIHPNVANPGLSYMQYEIDGVDAGRRYYQDAGAATSNKISGSGILDGSGNLTNILITDPLQDFAIGDPETYPMYGHRGWLDNFKVSTVVPEPSTLALLAAGLVGLLAYAWRKRK